MMFVQASSTPEHHERALPLGEREVLEETCARSCASGRDFRCDWRTRFFFFVFFIAPGAPNNRRARVACKAGQFPRGPQRVSFRTRLSHGENGRQRSHERRWQSAARMHYFCMTKWFLLLLLLASTGARAGTADRLSGAAHGRHSAESRSRESRHLGQRHERRSAAGDLEDPARRSESARRRFARWR